MHRTTTTATLLVTVAVSALAGCVTVQRTIAPGPPPTPSRPSAPHPDGSTQPQVVQGPAREALEKVGPPDHPSPSTVTSHRALRPAAATPPSAAPHHPSTASHPQSTAPHHPSVAQYHPSTAPPPPPKRAAPGPHSEVPPRVAEVFPRNAAVCALGHRYGGWQPDSPEATICRSTYGR